MPSRTPRRQNLLELLEQAAATELKIRHDAATTPPRPWEDITTAPRDGALLDVRFDPHQDAEPGMAEFYAPGCTRRVNPTEPVIENVAFANGSLRPISSADEAARALAAKGDFTDGSGFAYGIKSVTLTHWRPAAYPYLAG